MPARAKPRLSPNVDLTPRLRQAEDLAASGAHAEALGVMLGCWREKELPALADAIDLVSRACRRGQEAIEGRNGAEKDARWTALARQEKPEDLERLIETMTAKSAAETLTRLDELARRPRDPRLHRHLCGWMAAPPFRTGPFWTRVLAVVVETADPRALAGLHLTVGGWSKVKRAEKKLGARFPGGVPEATPEEAAAIAAIAAHVADVVPSPARVKAEAAAEADLLRAVHEHPEDDEPRRVYADWLLERGKPRGEFIQLQYARLEGRVARGAATREKKLLDAGWKEWLGGIDGLMHKEGMRFERGFADTLELVRVWGTKIWQRPAWATVRVVDWYHRPGQEHEVRELADGGWWRSLRAMLALDSRMLGGLSTSSVAPLLTAIGTCDHSGLGRDPFELLPRFPRLEELHYRTRHRIPPSTIAWMDDELVRRSGVRRLVLRDGYDSSFEISRDARGAFSVVAVRLVERYLDLPLFALEAMRAGRVSELRVQAGRALDRESLERLRAVCEALKPSVLELPGG